MEEKLTGRDYMDRPYLGLQSHPDFTPYAFRIVERIGKMTTEELEQIDLIHIRKRSKA